MSGHYLTTIPDGCTCDYTTQRIPGEPHIPAYLDGEPDPLCPVHFPGPAWLPDWVNNAVRFWRLAVRDPEQGQLTFGQWGDYKRRHVEHGWWLTPTTWGLGLDVHDDWRRDRYAGEGGQVWLLVQVGPLSWSVSLHQPYVEPVRPVPPYTIRPDADLTGL